MSNSTLPPNTAPGALRAGASAGADRADRAGRFGSLRGQWLRRNPREQQLIAIMTLAIALLLIWLIAVQPALQSLRKTPAELDELDLRLQQLQVAALESQSLRATPAVPQAQATQALRAATDRLGDKAKLIVQGDRATVTFTNVAIDGLRGWLGEARSSARARPVEAQLVKAGRGYNGSVSVILPGSA